MTVVWAHLNFATQNSSVIAINVKVVCQNSTIKFFELYSYFGAISLLPEGPTFSLRTVVQEDSCFIMNAGLLPMATF